MYYKMIKLRVIASGGGAKGIFQLGVLKQIFDSKLFEVDAVYGCSIGAVIAPYIANENVDKALDFFTKITKTDEIIERHRILGIKVPEWSWLLGLYSFFKLSAFKKSLIVEKVFGTLTSDEIKIAEGKCHVIAYDYTNGLETWFKGSELKIGMECSSALWLAFPPIKYNNNLYVDGGVSQYTPTDYILDHNHDTNYDGYYVIIDASARIDKIKRPDPSNGLEFVNQLHWSSAKMLNDKDVSRLKSKLGGRLYHIRPDEDFLGTLDFDPVKRANTLQAGLRKGAEFVKSLE